MTKYPQQNLFGFLLILTILLTSCSSSGEPAPEDIEALVNTRVASTVQAQQPTEAAQDSASSPNEIILGSWSNSTMPEIDHRVEFFDNGLVAVLYKGGEGDSFDIDADVFRYRLLQDNKLELSSYTGKNPLGSSTIHFPSEDTLVIDKTSEDSLPLVEQYTRNGKPEVITAVSKNEDIAGKWRMAVELPAFTENYDYEFFEDGTLIETYTSPDRETSEEWDYSIREEDGRYFISRTQYDGANEQVFEAFVAGNQLIWVWPQETGNAYFLEKLP